MGRLSHPLLVGLGACSLENILKSRCFEMNFGGFLKVSSINQFLLF